MAAVNSLKWSNQRRPSISAQSFMSGDSMPGGDTCNADGCTRRGPQTTTAEMVGVEQVLTRIFCNYHNFCSQILSSLDQIAALTDIPLDATASTNANQSIICALNDTTLRHLLEVCPYDITNTYICRVFVRAKISLPMSRCARHGAVILSPLCVVISLVGLVFHLLRFFRLLPELLSSHLFHMNRHGGAAASAASRLLRECSIEIVTYLLLVCFLFAGPRVLIGCVRVCHPFCFTFVLSRQLGELGAFSH